jgi:hypothetical protein
MKSRFSIDLKETLLRVGWNTVGTVGMKVHIAPNAFETE